MRARHVAPMRRPALLRSQSRRASCGCARRRRARPSRSRLFCAARPRSAWRALRLGTFMRPRPRKVAILGPVAERSRHPAQITIVREGLQHHRGKSSQHPNRPRMAGGRRKPPRAAPRPLDRARPFERMLAGAFLPAEMEQDARDIYFDRTDVLARAAQRRGKRQVTRGAAEKIWTDDRSDRPRVDRAIRMASYAPVD